MSLRLNARRNWLASRVTSSSPTCGILVLMMATRAAKTGVYGSDAAWAFMIDRQKRPRPRMRFSAKSSGTTCLMLDVLTCGGHGGIATTGVSRGRTRGRGARRRGERRPRTRRTLLMWPLIDFLRASQLSRWNSTLALSLLASICIWRSRAGGMYAPPLLLPAESLANSAAASKSGARVRAVEDDDDSSALRASWRSRSRRRAGSTSCTRGRSGGEIDRRRWYGGGECTREPLRGGEGDLEWRTTTRGGRRGEGAGDEPVVPRQALQRAGESGWKTHLLRLSSSDIGGRSDTDIDRRRRADGRGGEGRERRRRRWWWWSGRRVGRAAAGRRRLAAKTDSDSDDPPAADAAAQRLAHSTSMTADSFSLLMALF